MEQEQALRRFRDAIRIKTDWPRGAREGDGEAEAPLRRFQDFLAESYPSFQRLAERRVLSPYSLVYRWPGTGKGAGTSGETGGPDEAVLILAHYDVVPAEKEKWASDPFGAELKDGFVYGRGTQDMKGVLVALMEAAEGLARRGFRPRRDLWFAFGGDEERTGLTGALRSAGWFRERGLRFSWILDEGSSVVVNQIRGVEKPLALFSIEEKGFLSLELSVAQKPGHASKPPRVQAAAVLARALLRLSRRPFPYRLVSTVESFYSGLSSLNSGAPALAMARPRLLGPLFFSMFATGPQTDAMFRSTLAMTQLEGSSADNVMSSEVRAIINLRLLRPRTVEGAVEFVKRVVGDEEVSVKIYGMGSDPVPPNPEHSRLSGPGWKEMAAAVKRVFPDAAVLPFIMTATTDSRHYRDLAGGIFRFSPFKLSPADSGGVHGHDERLSLDNFFQAISFYRALFESL
ncbi:MAG: M20/M25/M40 family metallo-hydrolase [Treponema sp.]|jgi:carboxypeptidase PM20D1|nr:M20/M25/M40 family metallo-hydrolase [Treponema sp.]